MKILRSFLEQIAPINLWYFLVVCLDNLIGRALAESNLSKQGISQKRDAFENDKEQDSLKDKVNIGKEDSNNNNGASVDSKPTGAQSLRSS